MVWYALSISIFVCLVAIALILCTYKGVHDSLSSATVGNVYNFEYLQPVTGTYERYLAKVMSVHKLTDDEISHLNYISKYRMSDGTFKRSNTLITCKMMNGDIRNFYAERAINCRRQLLTKYLFTS